MPRTSYPEAETTTGARLQAVAEELREELLPIVSAAAGPAGRPSTLVRELGIDKSLASRLTRALRADDPLEFMYLLPAPTGLRIFLRAAVEGGIDGEACGEALSSVGRFQALIDETPGGRGTLDAAISASSAEARARNERSAKQAVYKAMSYLLGFRCETVVTTYAIQPSEDGRSVDALDIHQRIRLRRLRPTAPVGVFSLRLHPPTNGTEPQPSVETLGGELAQDVEDFFLQEYSSEPLPDFQIFKDGTLTTIAISEGEPSLDSPLTLTSGLLIRNVMEPYRTPEIKDEWRGYLLHSPCETVVRDIFIHEDLYAGTVPEITMHIPSPKGAETVRHPGLHGRLNTLDLATPVDNLGLGMGSISIRGVRSYPEMVQDSFERIGWDSSKFRGYRTRMIYPVPNILMTWWFSLPEAPASP